jgi:hypothetical protein
MNGDFGKTISDKNGEFGKTISKMNRDFNRLRGREIRVDDF